MILFIIGLICGFGLAIVLKVEVTMREHKILQDNFDTLASKLTEAQLQLQAVEFDKEEIKREGFKEGTAHIISSLQAAVNKENINHVWKINHSNTNDLKFLANALLGTYAKRKNNE